MWFKTKTAIQIIRWQGPRWVLLRIWRVLLLRCGYYQRKTPIGEWRVPSAEQKKIPIRTGNFLFSDNGFDSAKAFFESADQLNNHTTTEAAAIASGEFTFFHSDRLEVGCPPDWFACPYSGIQVASNDHWSRVAIPAGVDVKNIWELSRFSWFFPLISAYAKERDSRWAACFWELFDDWISKNAPNQGVHWRCGQETAIRLIAWAFAYYAFRNDPESTLSRQFRMQEAFSISAKRIATDLGYALSQKNNHGISECVGLITVALVFPDLPASKKWYARGVSCLTQQCQELFYASGEFSQHSSNYNRLALQALVFCIQLMRANKRAVPPFLLAALARGTCFLEQIIEPDSGDAPNSGGNDGALLFRFSNNDYTDFRPAVAAALVCLGHEHAYPMHCVAEELFWLGLGAESGGTGDDPSGLSNEPTRRQSGVATTQPLNHSTAPPGKCTLVNEYWRASLHLPHFRHRPAHADLLHTDIWHAGRRLAVDPGTFSYHSAKPYSSTFKQAAYHNTVVVNGRELMEWVSPFLAVPWPRIVMGEGKLNSSGQLQEISAKHDGYEALDHPVTHERTLKLDTHDLKVIDSLTSNEPNRYTLHWLFDDLAQAPSQILDPNNDGVIRWELQQRGCGYPICLEITTNGEAIEYDFVRADPHSARGWQSRYYNQVEPAWSLRFTCAGKSVKILSRFLCSPS